MDQGNLIEELGKTMANGHKATEVLGDGTDIAFHSMFERGIFDDVPVFGFFAKMCNVVSDIQAYRFCKKIYKFVFLTREYDREAMNAFWHEYASANKENGYELVLMSANMSRAKLLFKESRMKKLRNHGTKRLMKPIRRMCTMIKK